MSLKSKKLYLIIGLLTCAVLVMIMLLNVKPSYHNLITPKHDPETIQSYNRVIMRNGSQWIIQTTYKLLQNN